jgi:hypothetical protein
MPVQNLECQIHVVLMKRFLDGDELGPELQEQLEQHLKACPSCRAILENEKTSIEEVLDGPSAPANPVMAWMQSVMPGSKTRSGYAVTDAHSALMAPTTVHRPAPGMAAFKNPQVLMLSAALAVVLILMSTVFRDPTRFLGPKAAAKPAVAAPAEGESKTEDPKAEGEASASEGKTEEAVEPEPKPAPEETKSDGDHADGHSGDHSEGHAEDKPANHAEDHAATDHAAKDHEAADQTKPADSATKDSHAKDSHAEESAAAKPAAKPTTSSTTRPDGTVVPGQRTLDKSEITVVGGSAPKPAARQATQARPAAQTASPRRSSSSASNRRRTETTRRTSSQRRSAARPSTSRPSQPATPRGSGVVVYDKNGNRLN